MSPLRSSPLAADSRAVYRGGGDRTRGVSPLAPVLPAPYRSTTGFPLCDGAGTALTGREPVTCSGRGGPLKAAVFADLVPFSFPWEAA
jgi:hypothetical protein